MTDRNSGSRNDFTGWVGRTAFDPTGEKIGSISDVYLDDATGLPEWFAVKTGLFGTHVSFVPTTGSRRGEQGLTLGFEKAKVKDAPRIDEDGALSVGEERSLYEYYGLGYEPHYRDDRLSEMQEFGSASATDAAEGEINPDTAVARLRRREDEEVDEMFGD